MSVPSAWDKITAYMAENKVKAAMEAEVIRQTMAVEASDSHDENGIIIDERLDCIYDDEPLGFEKDSRDSVKRMQAQDPRRN